MSVQHPHLPPDPTDPTDHHTACCCSTACGWHATTCSTACDCHATTYSTACSCHTTNYLRLPHCHLLNCLQLPCCHLLNRLWPLHCFQAQSHLCLSQRSALRKDLLCPSQRFCGLSGLAMPTPEICSLWGPIQPTIAWAAQPQLAAPAYCWSSAMPRRYWTCGRHQNFFSATTRSAAGHQNNFSTAAGPGSHVLLWV